MSSRYPMPIPWGWFQVGFGSDVPAGEMRPVRLCGNDFVLVRAQCGELALVDAYCPHQGARFDEPPAPLVDGKLISCPFHGWRFDLGGRCADIPYSEEIPAGADIRALPIEERAGMVFAWYHPAGLKPSHALPDFLDQGPAEWSSWDMVLDRDVQCHIQEMGEQAADAAHFPATHGVAEYPSVESFETTGHEVESRFSLRVAWPDGVHVGNVVTRVYGLGFVLVELSGVADVWMLHTYAPLDEESLHIRCFFRSPVNLDPEQEARTRGWMAAFKKAIKDDIRVFEHKRYNARPLLVAEERCVAEYRRWASQFYDMQESVVEPEVMGAV